MRIKVKKILKWAGIIFLGLIVLGVIGSFLSPNKTQNNTQTSTGSNQNQTQEPTATKAPEAMKVTAKEIADDFDGNQVAAEQKWAGKLVEFSAPVGNITDSGVSFTNIGSKQFSFTQISCKIKDKQQLLSLKNGETATVRGVLGKQTIGVIDLSDCEVVQ